MRDHALVDAVFDSVDRFSEHKPARRFLASLTEGTLLLADRNFAGYELWGLARTTGAHLAWRIKKRPEGAPAECSRRSRRIRRRGDGHPGVNPVGLSMIVDVTTKLTPAFRLGQSVTDKPMGVS